MTHTGNTPRPPETTDQIDPAAPSEASPDKDQPVGRTRRNWIPAAAVIAFGVALLGWEYREALYPLLASPLLFLVVCVGMHFLMHRGHGKH